MQLVVPRSPAPPVWRLSVHPGAHHAPISRLPRTVPEYTGRNRHLMAEGSAVAPLSCPQARTITQVFIKKLKCFPLPHPGRVPRAPLIKAKHIRINSAVATPAVPPRRKATGFDTPHSVQSEGARPRTDFDSPALACDALAGGDMSVAVGSALGAPATQGPAVAGRGVRFSTRTQSAWLCGLGP